MKKQLAILDFDEPISEYSESVAELIEQTEGIESYDFITVGEFDEDDNLISKMELKKDIDY